MASILNEVHEEMEGFQRRDTIQFYEALTKIIKRHLRHDGKVALPGLFRFVVKYKPATPKGERMNPFTKKKQMFEAKPATMRLKAFPAKQMKDYVADKVEVKAPQKKKK